MCVCMQYKELVKAHGFMSVCVHVYVCMYMCVCECVYLYVRVYAGERVPVVCSSDGT